MSQLKFGAAGVSAREIDVSQPPTQEPVGVPAGVIGTSVKGRAFVPTTLGTKDDFDRLFGASDGTKFGPLAAYEWLRNAGSLTYLRVLGVGDGRQRVADGTTAGSVTNAGFVVGAEQPDHDNDGTLSPNPYANPGQDSVLGRTYLLGAFMSESLGSTVFSDANLQGASSNYAADSSVPIVRGILMAPSGVILKLSQSFLGNNAAPASTYVAVDNGSLQGSCSGSVVLLANSVAKQEFTMLLNGHKGTNSLYPNVITASFDMTAPNYFANVFNKDPRNMQQAGHYLYTHWDVHPAVAVVTGSGLAATGSGATYTMLSGVEMSAFLVTGSAARNVGSATSPNYENFQDRFAYASTPWFVSQKFGGQRYNLFKLHALDAGSAAGPYKVSVENIAPSSDVTSPYGSFDVVIRAISDRDNEQVILEQWRGVSLNPSDDRYICKVIGDANVFFDFDRSESAQKIVVEGQYPNNSTLVYVEVTSDVENAETPEAALPFGFRGNPHLVTSGSAPVAGSDGDPYLKRIVEPPVPLRKTVTAGSGAKLVVNPRLYWGVQFEHVTSLTTPNGSTQRNESVDAYAIYKPGFLTAVQPFAAGDNSGAADSTTNGVLDADRFNNNLFALDNVQVVTASNTLADPAAWSSATYVRGGNIPASDVAKTRAFSVSDLTQANRAYAKFSTFMQGGFDGVNTFDAYAQDISNVAVTEDMDATNRGRNEGPNVRAYAKAIEIMQNTVNTDLQLLAIPGIRHPVVTDRATSAVEDRFDALYIMDVEQYDNQNVLVTADSQLPSVQYTANSFSDRSLDSSFAAAYFPDVVMQDPTTKTNLFVPPSVALLGAIALNDNVGHPWYAPAGFARGALSTTLETRVKLSKENMDTLYDVNLNPLVAFPGSATSGTGAKGGVVVWGQKTLQQAASALDRVNVRRLLIDVRRQVREVARTIQFEPSREATLAKFQAAVEPKLQRVQKLSGVEKYKVQIDTTTTTQRDILDNTLRGKIWLVPTKSTEYVSLDFVVSNNVSQVG